MSSSSLTALLLLPPLLERLQSRFASLLYILGNDTTGVEERWSLAPFLLLAWLLAALFTAPLSHLMAHFLGSSSELRKSAGTALGIATIQVGFFALTWFVIVWGRRGVDGAVFGMSALLAALIAKWGHEIPYLKCLILVLSQAVACLLLLFLIAFVAAELGYTDF